MSVNSTFARQHCLISIKLPVFIDILLYSYRMPNFPIKIAIFGLFTNLVSLISANESIYGKSARTVHVPFTMNFLPELSLSNQKRRKR